MLTAIDYLTQKVGKLVLIHVDTTIILMIMDLETILKMVLTMTSSVVDIIEHLIYIITLLTIFQQLQVVRLSLLKHTVILVEQLRLETLTEMTGFMATYKDNHLNIVKVTKLIKATLSAYKVQVIITIIL